MKNKRVFVLAATMQFRNSKGYYIFFALATIHKNTKGISSLFYFSAGLLLTQQPYLRILTLFTMAKFTCLYYSPQMFEANLKPTLFFFLLLLRRFVKIKNLVLFKCLGVFGHAWVCLEVLGINLDVEMNKFL